MTLQSQSNEQFPQTGIGQCRDGHQVRLLPLSEKDGASLAQVFADITPWADYEIPSEALEHYLCTIEPGAPRLGIILGERVVGAAGLRLNWMRGPYLQFLGVEPKFQNRGLGGLVLTWMERETRAREGKNLWVMVSHMDGSARPFYEKHGFNIESQISDLVVDGRHEILMRKRLTD